MSVPKVKVTTTRKSKGARVGIPVPLSSIVGFNSGDPLPLQRESMDFEDFVVNEEAEVRNSAGTADGGGDINKTLLNLIGYPSLAAEYRTVLIRTSSANISENAAMIKQGPSKEFHLSQLDFPPLPGATDELNGNVTTDDKSDLSDLNERLEACVITDSSSIMTISGDTATTAYAADESANATGSMDTVSFEQPSGRDSIMAANDFGLLNLLPLLRAPDTCPTATMLTVGFAYEGLGIDFNTSEPLYKRLVSPLYDQPLALLAPKAPSQSDDYEINVILPSFSFKERPEETVFYIFYNIHGDLLQLEAAEELYYRGWRYHLDFLVWIYCMPDAQYEKNGRLVTGTFIVFDHIQWKKVLKFMEINLDKLEVRQNPNEYLMRLNTPTTSEDSEIENNECI